jgi:hypothetical protein
MTKYVFGGVIAVGLAFFCASSNAQAKEIRALNHELSMTIWS